MPDNFNFEKINIIDVNSVRNFLVQAENAKNRKTYPFSFHFIYAIVCAALIYFAFDGMSIGLGALLCAVCLCLAPAMCVFNYLYSPMPLKILATFLPPVIFGVKTALSSNITSFAALASPLFMYIMCILVSAALTKVSLSGYTKSTCFIAVTVIYVVITLLVCAFLLISVTGTCSPAAAVGAIDGFFETSINNVMEYAASEEGLESLTLMLEGTKDMTSEKLLEVLEESLTLSASLAKSTLPSAFILTCMLFAFITVEFFSVIAKKFKIDVFVCIMDDFWTYRLSRATTMMYDIVFFAYILGMFIEFPGFVGIAVTNLLMIMTPVVFIPGMKSIYHFFRRKKMGKTPAVIISCIIALAAVMLTGMLGIYIISSVGVSFVVSREIHESMLFPAKFAHDTETYRKLYGKDVQNTDSDSNNTDNNQH